jgi:hypothetical protein
VLAGHEHGRVGIAEHGRGTGDDLHRQEPRPRNVPEAGELLRRPYVEHGHAVADERCRLGGADAGHLAVVPWIELHGVSVWSLVSCTGRQA